MADSEAGVAAHDGRATVEVVGERTPGASRWSESPRRVAGGARGRAEPVPPVSCCTARSPQIRRTVVLSARSGGRSGIAAVRQPSVGRGAGRRWRGAARAGRRPARRPGSRCSRRGRGHPPRRSRSNRRSGRSTASRSRADSSRARGASVPRPRRRRVARCSRRATRRGRSWRSRPADGSSSGEGEHRGAHASRVRTAQSERNEPPEVRTPAMNAGRPEWERRIRGREDDLADDVDDAVGDVDVHHHDVRSQRCRCSRGPATVGGVVVVSKVRSCPSSEPALAGMPVESTGLPCVDT